MSLNHILFDFETTLNLGNNDQPGEIQMFAENFF